MVRFASVAVVLFGVIAANGQVLSPRKTTSITIDGKKITVGYGAPSMRGRKIMGRLVPYGEVWCAGANDATSLETDADLDIGGLKVLRGNYTLWALPNADEWRLIVNKETGQWHTEYHEDRDLGRVRMTTKSLPDPVEVFRIELTPTGGNKAKLSLIWENTEASVPISVVQR